MEAVIRNTFIQGTLSIVFALMVVIVFGAGLIMVMRVLRGGGTPLTEDEPVASKLFAPSGLIPTKAEREVQKQWDALPTIARQIGWYWGTLMGDNHYRRYVEHRRRTHPGEPVMSEREYWRMRHDAIESNPNPRCC